MSEASVIRAAVPDDYEQIAALLAEVDELHRAQLPWLFGAPTIDPRPLRFFEQLLAGDNSIILVADAGSIVGTAKVLLRSAPEFPVFIQQTWAVLDNIAVAKAWRRRGVGTALTHAAEAWAQQQNVKWLELGVYEFNAGARAFYETLGYLPVSTKLRKPLLPNG
ncbi:MAG TPA: GNAT family N-acetyltransferase [Polyangiaceae bacterium]|jgi:ribosomal protein S18 acetylase RimI-like enzyme|nr:GNAT family N-acetyltransferase [Polyangiaceae bacterium]